MSNEYFGTDDFSFAEFVQKMEMVRWRWKTGKAVSCIYLLTVPPEAPKKAPPSNFNNEQSNNIVSQEMASKKTDDACEVNDAVTNDFRLPKTSNLFRLHLRTYPDGWVRGC